MPSAHHPASADRYLLRPWRQTNVLFFTKGTVTNPHQDKNCTDDVWVYDLRTNMPSFGKRTPFTEQHLQPFETVYGEDPHGLSPREEGEWSFNAEESEVADSEENKNTDQHQSHQPLAQVQPRVDPQRKIRFAGYLG